MSSPLILLGADHAGFALKERLKSALQKKNINIQDLSPVYQKDDDYPATGKTMATEIVHNPRKKGILICGSGTGMAMAANRIKGARAVAAADPKTIQLARRDNDANILSLSGWQLTLPRALALIEIFLQTPFSKATRHKRRIQALDSL